MRLFIIFIGVYFLFRLCLISFFLLISNLDFHNVTCISCNSHLLTIHDRNTFRRPPKIAIIGFIRYDQNMNLIKWKLPCFVIICCTVTLIQTEWFKSVTSSLNSRLRSFIEHFLFRNCRHYTCAQKHEVKRIKPS